MSATDKTMTKPVSSTRMTYLFIKPKLNIVFIFSKEKMGKNK